MKVVFIMGILLVSFLIVWFEWTRLHPKQKKEWKTILFLLGLSCTLAILLVFYPEMPGPTQLVERIYHPFLSVLKG